MADDSAAPIDVMALLQQLQQGGIAAPSTVPPTPTVLPTNNQGIDAILNAAQMQAQLAQFQNGLNPLGMLALTSTMQNSNPLLQNIARMLLTLNMGQFMATQQSTDLLSSLTQQDSSMNAFTRGNLPFPISQTLPMQQPQQVQQQYMMTPQAPLKRAPPPTSHAPERKKMCPQQQPQQQPRPAAASIQVPVHARGHPHPRAHPQAHPQGHSQAHPQAHPQAHAHAHAQAHGRARAQVRAPVQAPQPPPRPERSPTPPYKRLFANLTQEEKAQNEYFNREIMKRLDIILMEELGTEDEDEKEKERIQKEKEKKLEEEAVEKKKKMGAEGSAFRKITSHNSTSENTSISASNSGSVSPSTGSLSSGLNSPTMDVEPLPQEYMDMMNELGRRNREVQKIDVAEPLNEMNFEKRFPQIWNGTFMMKSSEAFVNLHLISGSREMMDSTLGNMEMKNQRKTLRINQRLNVKTQHHHILRLMTSNEHTCCLAMPAGFDKESLEANVEKMKKLFVEYLQGKNIAGIARLGEEDHGMLSPSCAHVFPPEFISSYLETFAPIVHQHLAKKKTYLFVVFEHTDPTASNQNSDSTLKPSSSSSS